MLIFGAGVFYGMTSGANPTPRKFGHLQDIAIDFSFNMKEAHGQYQLPIDIRRGAQKITGKAKSLNLNGAALNDLFFGQTAATGLLLSSIAEPGTIPSATAYTVTVANSATFDTDLGVVYAATGLPFTRVASAPTAGQYSEALGVYTFASADAGKAVLIDYLYTAVTGGTKITMINQMMGATPTFFGVFTADIGGKVATLKLNQCTSSKLNVATKLEDYTIPEFDFSVMADASNAIGVLSISD